jgi:hypothetical protein
VPEVDDNLSGATRRRRENVGGPVSAAVLVAQKVVNELPVSPYVYGGTALAVLVGLLAITFAFRSVGTRHH